MIKALFCILAIISLAGGPVAQAKDPAAIKIHIAAATVAEAVIQWAEQTGFRVVWADDSSTTAVAGPALDGTFTPQQALQMLLRNTDLQAQFPDARTAIVGRAEPRVAQKTSLRLATASSAMPYSDSSADTGALDEVLVSAEKRIAPIQEVPVPVSALPAESLTKTDKLLLMDYATLVPGFTVEPLEFNNTALALRGITTGGFTNPTVGITIDGIPFGAGIQPPNLDPGDLARIEVLRGPQGTLYGASSMGGLVNYVTKDPQFDGYHGRVETGTNFVHGGDKAGYKVRGALNVPFSDTFAIRLSAFNTEDPGYIDNPVLNLKDVNKAKSYGGQIASLWQPSSDFSVKLSALYNHLKTDGSSEVNLPTDGYPQTAGLGDLQQNYIPGIGQETSVQNYSGTVKARIGGIDVLSQSNYNVYYSPSSFDWSSAFSSNVMTDFNVAGAPFYDLTRFAKLSQEIRLSGSFGERFDWLVGGFYAHTFCDCREYLAAADATTGRIVGQDWVLIYPYTLVEGAAFADLTYHITDRIDIQVGGRESRDTLNDRPFIQTGPFIGPDPSISPAEHSQDNAFTYLVTPRFRVSPDLMIYARFASGYRPGGPNSPQPGIPSQFNPDKTRNYELGLKGDFIDHKLSVDTSLYYIDWKNIQVQAFGPQDITFTTNGSGAKSEGVEISVQARPWKGLTVGGWIAYDNAVLTEDFPAGPIYGVAGDRLPFSSRFSGNLSVTDEFPIVMNATGFVSAVAIFTGDRLDIFTDSAQRQTLPSYAALDLQTGVRYDSWDVSLYANNITDKRGFVSGGVGNVLPFAFTYIKPRTIGLSVSKAF